MKTTITPQELKSLLEQNKALLIDVRERGEYETRHIEGACLVSMPELTHDRVRAGDKVVVLQCELGIRSERARERLTKQDPSLEIFSLKGGIDGWCSAGYEVIGTKKMPVMRQVQLMMGSLALLGLAMGAFVNPWFYLLPTAINLGFVISGITGWCGMAMLLLKMPWNRDVQSH